MQCIDTTAYPYANIRWTKLLREAHDFVADIQF